MSAIRILLDTPIKRGKTEITELQLRKPKAGELRGLSIYALLTVDATAVSSLLPRITTPSLTEEEAQRLDPADLAACGVQIADFFVQKRQKQVLDGVPESSGSQDASKS